MKAEDLTITTTLTRTELVLAVRSLEKVKHSKIDKASAYRQGDTLRVETFKQLAG